jgi:hypothetical protein
MPGGIVGEAAHGMRAKSPASGTLDVNLLQLIDDVHRSLPATAPSGARAKASSTLSTPHGEHTVAVAVRIDPQGRRREQLWCDGVRVERPVLLRLTCPETECPQAIQVRAQWLAYRQGGPARARADDPCPRPLMAEVPVAVASQQLVARPARFPCFTPCPHGAHPPLTIDKSGFDLFEHGACLGGGVATVDGVRRPRLPTLRAAEAFVLARHLEALATIATAAEASGPQRRRSGGAG